MWVRSEYAGELAVLSAWLCALLPWSLSYGQPGAGHQVRIHFTYLYLQFTPGLDFAGFSVFVHEGPASAANETIATGYQLWIAGAALLTLAVALSVVYYVYEERLEETLPVDPVRLMGGLLVAAGIPLVGAIYFLWTGLAAWTLPVGVVFMFVLGGALLTVERT